MNEKYDINYRSAILRLLFHILVYTLIIHIVVAVFCYFKGWSTYFYGHSLVWGGVIVIALGLTSALGGSHSPSRHIGVSNPTPTTQYLKQRDSDMIGSYRFLILSSVVGILTILSGSLVQTL